MLSSYEGPGSQRRARRSVSIAPRTKGISGNASNAIKAEVIIIPPARRCHHVPDRQTARLGRSAQIVYNSLTASPDRIGSHAHGLSSPAMCPPGAEHPRDQLRRSAHPAGTNYSDASTHRGPLSTRSFSVDRYNRRCRMFRLGSAAACISYDLFVPQFPTCGAFTGVMPWMGHVGSFSTYPNDTQNATVRLKAYVCL